ncbi:type II toxin-antitoxin system HicA family toxin [Halorubrum pallidum]|uniref:Type II toxin-antitoxin system HicA family toxin n=1 Tax=Halorubrum pallidum TaxID=1526114 RepID=A0ABD5T880_9EURY
MVYANFAGREIVKALRAMRYRPVGREGSHVKLRYEHPETDEIRVVSVPLTDSDHISQDTYRSIAGQCDADDFESWCQWIDEHR